MKRAGPERCDDLPKVRHRVLVAVGKQNKISILLGHLGSLVLGHASGLKDFGLSSTFPLKFQPEYTLPQDVFNGFTVSSSRGSDG